MKETTSRLLAYAKEFLIAGERELEQDSNVAYMQAILRFHDAIEFCVRAVIEEYNINHDRNSDLLPLMKFINSFFTDKKLPLASQMDFLNAARGKIKHHASVPSHEDVQRCRLYTKDFLEQVTKNYINIDFFTVSRLLLIENKAVREYIELAENKVKESDYLEALILAKKAFYVAKPSDEAFIVKDRFLLSSFSLVPGSGLTTEIHSLEYLREPLGKIVDKINKLEESMALLMMGVDTLKLRRFEEITPHFSFYFNGCHIFWSSEIQPTEELAREAITYVVDITLSWQSRGIVSHRPERSPRYRILRNPLREIRNEDWAYWKENESDDTEVNE